MEPQVSGLATNPYDDLPRVERMRLTRVLLARAADAEAAERRDLLDRVVLANMCVVRSIAARYVARGIAQEDLEQVAYAALVRCVHRFDPDEGRDLLSYLVPSVRGELRRHFRDHGWVVRPSRRVQELQSRVVAERAALPSGEAGGDEQQAVAERLGVSRAEVAEALAAQGCFAPTSLDAPAASGGGAGVGDVIPCPRADRDREAAEARVMLVPALRCLSPRERHLVDLRFFEDRSQQEIAVELGVTQAQVSRLLARVLRDLRESLERVPA